MSNTFGAVYINGIQQALPGQGIQGIGPFAIGCSGVQDTSTWVVNTTATVPVPAGTPAGVILTPPSGGTVAWSYKTTSGDTGIHGSKASPSFLAFDSANLPSNIYLTSASSVPIVVQFI